MLLSLATTLIPMTRFLMMDFWGIGSFKIYFAGSLNIQACRG